VREMLHGTLDAAHSFSDWFARVLAWIFADTPLLIYQPDCAAARREAAPLFAKEIETPLETARAINEAGAALEQLGYAPQLVKNDGDCCFFLEVDGRRRKVLREQDSFVLPRENIRLDGRELLAMLEAAPGRFLPNVALRCVAQQALFPVAAYVAGPGEIAYWAQLGPVFKRFGLPMPAVYPRARCVVTTQKQRQLLEKYRLNLNDLDAPEEMLLDRALAATQSNPALDALRAHREPVSLAYAVLLDALEGAGPRARIALDMARTAAAAAEENLERVERAAVRADTAQTEAARKQMTRLREALQPDRKPQERVYCVFSFLFEQGREFLPRLFKAIRLDSGEIREVKL
jgi:bacillithiol synthase